MKSSSALTEPARPPASGALVDAGWLDAHLRDPAVRVHRGRVLEAEALGPRVPIELDGEPLGFLPARFEVLPGALSLVGPAA